MKYLLLLLFPFLICGCTKNNQGEPDNFAYLSVDQIYLAANNPVQNYDIDNDGQIDWGFVYESCGSTCVKLYPNFTNQYCTYVADSAEAPIKILSTGFNINNAILTTSFREVNRIYYKNNPPGLNTFLAGYGDFYIGFKTQNPSRTNTFFGWARLNLSSDGKTLIVKDMAINTINGGSINVGQH
jgi:hypothetical protein